ncbi:hypothetical protein CLV52_0034 [Amnibacterium kyonggiense]|uniref:Uncharacterized protein n=1 Tax=Amnibacterium kyonggiense TaxID=595671 RepID=A0A4R7FP47_9MICO|nr:hypothetical protein CLV52_0034 [Amnibacterium kyonggiense]
MLPHSSNAKRILVAWVDSGDVACGKAKDIWVRETRMQVLITVYEPPTLSGRHRTTCIDQGSIHIQAIHLRPAIGDRTTNAFRGTLTFGSF